MNRKGQITMNVLKRKLVFVQLMAVFCMVALNLSPQMIRAQEQYYVSDITDTIELAQSVSSSIQSGQQEVYWLELDKAKEILFEMDAILSENTQEDVDATIRIIKAEEKQNEEGTFFQAAGTIFQENMSFDEELSYQAKIKRKLEKASYLVIIENQTERFDIDVDVSCREAVSNTTNLRIPSNSILTKGSKKKLEVTSVKPEGKLKGVTWSSSNTSIARVDRTGKVTARQYGKANIRVKLSNGNTYVCSVAVEDPKLSQSSMVLLKGESGKIAVTKNYNKVFYTSGNKRIADVNASGMIYAKGKGTARIIATVGNRKLVCKVKVETPKLNVTKAAITAGKTKNLRVKGTAQRVFWSSSDTSVATVSQNGKVRTKKAGTATITAQIAGKKIAHCVVVVKAKKVIIKQKRKQQSNAGGTVYVTQYGTKYHRAGCRYLWNSRIPISLSEARRSGYDACSVCF